MGVSTVCRCVSGMVSRVHTGNYARRTVSDTQQDVQSMHAR